MGGCLLYTSSEDHLDYHGSVENYYRAKARLFENQTDVDFAVLNASDPAVARLREDVRARLLWFARGPVERGAGIERGRVALFNRGEAVAHLCPVGELALPGEHNLENALAAAAAAWAAGAAPEAIGRVLRCFKAIAHRLEFVAEIGGVEFINDSKGTNPGAVIKALRSFPGKRKILLAGGRDKGSDFSELAEVIKEEVGTLILFGESRAKLARAAAGAGFTAYLQTATLEEMCIRDRLDTAGLMLRLVGEGQYIVNQTPKAGASVPRQTQIVVYLSEDDAFSGGSISMPDLRGFTVKDVGQVLNWLGLYLEAEGCLLYTSRCV